MTVYPKSVSIADLMRAGKLVKPPEATILKLGYFDVESGKWVTIPQLEVEIEQKHFASGAFRFAFQAKCIKVLTGLGVDWVVKKYSEDTAKAIMDTLKMSLESHARKQVQMQYLKKQAVVFYTSHLSYSVNFRFHPYIAKYIFSMYI